MYLISVWLTLRFHLSPGAILKTILLDLVFVISRIIKVEVSVKSSESTTAADNTYWDLDCSGYISQKPNLIVALLYIVYLKKIRTKTASRGTQFDFTLLNYALCAQPTD